MTLDRWVVPPAVAAAISAVLAVAPPLSSRDARRGWRVEVIHLREGARHAILLRASVDDRGAETLAAPAAATLRLATARGELAPRRLTAVPGSAWLYADAVADAPFTAASLDGAGLHARVALPSPTTVAEPAAPAAGDLLVGVLEGALIPGVEGTAVFSSRDEVAEWRVEPVMETARTGAEVKTRSMALVRIRVDAMGAPVTVVRRTFDGSERRDGARLAVSPMGVAVDAPLPSFASPDRVTLRASVPGVAHLVWGDERGACAWTAARLDAAETGAAAVLALPTEGPCVPSWIEGTTDATLAQRVGRRVAQAPAQRRVPGHPDIFAPWPSPPSPALALDGARVAEAQYAARVRRARRFALGAVALSVALELALVLGASARRSADELVPVEHPLRARAGALAAGLALMIVVGLAMALAALLQT